ASQMQQMGMRGARQGMMTPKRGAKIKVEGLAAIRSSTGLGESLAADNRPITDLQLPLSGGNRLPGVPHVPFAFNAVVKGVALDRLAPRLLDQAANLVDRQDLRSGRSGVVVNQLVPHRAIQVVGPIGQRD